MSTKPREITGRTVLIIAVSAFGVILAANLTMLWAATGSFPGLVVENSYRAGVGWDDRARAQEALGWESVVGYEGGRLAVALTDAEGRTVEGLAVSALVGRPADDSQDRRLRLAALPDGSGYGADLALEPGRWRVALEADRTDGTGYRAETVLFVSGRD